MQVATSTRILTQTDICVDDAGDELLPELVLTLDDDGDGELHISYGAQHICMAAEDIDVLLDLVNRAKETRERVTAL